MVEWLRRVVPNGGGGLEFHVDLDRLKGINMSRGHDGSGSIGADGNESHIKGTETFTNLN